MKKRYALNLSENGQILSATYEEYAVDGMPIVDELPNGNIVDYKYIDGAFIYDPIPIPEPEPSEDDDTTAMLIDLEYRVTLIELGIVD